MPANLKNVMFNFNSLRLRYWIATGYAMPILLLIGSAYVVFENAQLAREKVEELEASAAIAQDINLLAINTRAADRAAIAYLLQKDHRVAKAYADAKELYREKLASLQQVTKDGDQKKSLESLELLLGDIEEFNEGMIDLVNQGKQKEAIELWRREQGGERTLGIGDLIDSITAKEKDIVAKNQEVQDESLEKLSNVVLMVTVLSVLVSITMGWVLISGMVGRMNREAQAIAAASVQIASTVEEQERVASQQASSVNETTTTMHELSASSRQSAQQAEAAAISARQIMVLASGVVAAEDHFNGKSSLKDQSKQIAAQVMTLSEQLRQIYSITTVVSEIANQTNMLAINAAVEGVRAGDAGKGFGVVAAEIRKLADQSRKSAEKIEDIIKNLEKAANATVKVTETGTQAVDEMVKSINDIALNIQQISYTAGQQATAISQVMEAMTHINNGAQATASGIAQTKVSTENLNTTAQKLKELV